MPPLRSVATWVKRAESPSAARLKRMATSVLAAEAPAPRWLFGPLFALHQARGALRSHAAQVAYYQPMFRARARRVGRRLNLYGGFPYIYGDLMLDVGDDCKISAQTSLVAGHVFDEPTLELGDHTNLGPGVVISVCRSVKIGSWVRVGSGAFIADNPGHPLQAGRRRHEAVTREQVRPVVIEDDVWVGTRATILPGVRVGARSVIGAGAVVTRDVPADVVVAGNPARVVRSLSEGREALVVPLTKAVSHG
jgi:acetyltransferase-like isoleucine patch superfamily enzyme